jgi:hypothetical protein
MSNLVEMTELYEMAGVHYREVPLSYLVIIVTLPYASLADINGLGPRNLGNGISFGHAIQYREVSTQKELLNYRQFVHN